MKITKFCLLLLCSTCLIGCGQVDATNSFNNSFTSFETTSGRLAEMPTPKVIRELNQQLEKYSPKVQITSPQAKQILNQTNIAIRLEVEDLPVFKDDKFKLGNHLNLILDNEPAQKIYDLTKPVLLENLTPGTHTIRVFATRPWGESYKNDGAYAQITFSVLTETNNNSPDRNLPLLTYSNPTGTYSAEPFLLDFYLTNAPLHSVAQNDPKVNDWQIKTTVNGDSFVLENWQPVYLSGLNKGKNWIQLELIDETGNDLENAFNNTVRVINYDPQQTDTLSKLVTDKISLAEAESIVEQSYYIQPVGEPEIIEPISSIEEPKSVETEVIDSTIEAIEEPTVEDKTERETPEKDQKDEMIDPISEEKRSQKLERDLNLAVNENIAATNAIEIPKQPVIIPVPAIKEQEEATKINQDNLAEDTETVDSTEYEPTVILNPEDSDSLKSITAIEIPQAESVEISGDEIAVTIPAVESKSLLEPEVSSPPWWKKILVGLRQRLENLVKLLPNEV